MRRRGAGWEYYFREKDPRTGNPRQRSKGGFPSEKEAHRALRVELSALDSGTYVSRSGLTLREFAERQWLPAIQSTVRPATFYSYSRNLRLHVLPTLGHLPLQEVEAPRLNILYAELLKQGRKDHAAGQGLSVTSVRYLHTIVGRLFKDALRWQLVLRNPALLADPPRPSSQQRREFATWTSEQLRAFLTALRGDRLHALYVLLATTGMRRGEALGLAWRDLDLDRARLSVRRTLITVVHEPVFGDPKTRKGRRVVALDSGTVAALRGHRAAQAAERLAAGAWGEDDLVFTDANGRFLHPERFTRTFQIAAVRAGLPQIRLHDLRHTWATLALEAGVNPKVVSERLGHSNISITLDIYSHVSPTMQAEAAERVAGLLDL